MNINQSIKKPFSDLFLKVKTQKEMKYLILFTLALGAFEAFNYSTTDFALSDLLGELKFFGIRWATLLSIAFCGVDFAGIAHLLAPQINDEGNRSSWYLFGAWILAATMNAILTWWGVVLAVQSHQVLSTGVVNESTVLRTVPVFIALMVWVIRIMVVGSFSKKASQFRSGSNQSSETTMSRREFRQAQSRAAHPATNNAVFIQPQNSKRGYRPEPTYIPLQDETVFHSMKSPVTGQRRV